MSFHNFFVLVGLWVSVFVTLLAGSTAGILLFNLMAKGLRALRRRVDAWRTHRAELRELDLVADLWDTDQWQDMVRENQALELEKAELEGRYQQAQADADDYRLQVLQVEDELTECAADLREVTERVTVAENVAECRANALEAMYRDHEVLNVRITELENANEFLREFVGEYMDVVQHPRLDATPSHKPESF